MSIMSSSRSSERELPQEAADGVQPYWWNTNYPRGKATACLPTAYTAGLSYSLANEIHPHKMW